ncbi:MAG: S8 family serine peptidase [Phycisphaerales bacterium]|nr:S8 family serine peptidase [Phycisphaerales bacterium]
MTSFHYAWPMFFTALTLSASLEAGSMQTGMVEHVQPIAEERVPLDIDGDRLALFIDGLSSAGAAAVLVSDIGLEASDMVPSSVPGWFYIDVSGSAFFTGRPVFECIDDLLRLDRFDMVSPVYLAGNLRLPWVPTRDVIISIDPAMNHDEAAKQVARHVPGVIVNASLGGLPNTFVVQTPLTSGADVLDLVNGISGIGPVVYAEPDAISIQRHYLIPNDPLFSQQWALNQSNDVDMDAPEAWDVTIGSDAVVVVVLDDGGQQGHPDLHQLPGETFSGSGSGSGNHATACDGHGTCVASCVSSTINNATDVVGVAPGCYTRAGKIFNSIDFFGFCLGFLEFQDSWAVNGITWAETVGARITNSSWGGGAASASINAAYAATANAGVLHFAAAGNDGTSTIGWPANNSNVLAISATASNGSLASFSTYGNGLFASAPGASILVSDRTGSDGFGGSDTTTIDGTSFASPYAAGVAAMILSMDINLTPAEVRSIMETTSSDYGGSGYDTTFGWGMVNAFAAVKAVDVEDPCPADIDGNGSVGVDDLLALIANWGPCTGCAGDFDESGAVGVDDLLLLIGSWGPCS